MFNFIKPIVNIGLVFIITISIIGLIFMKRLKYILSLSINSILLFNLSVFANPKIDLNLDAKKLVVINGKEKYEDANAAQPGDVVVYTLRVVNNGDSSAKKVEPVGNIPSGTSYIPETTNSKDYKLFFSIDNGKSFQEKPIIKVKEKGKDLVKPAPFEMYNKIKWSFSKNLDAQKSVALIYKVKVK
jgi:uncharacterized repeat protein (TIGR01451 family)